MTDDFVFLVGNGEDGSFVACRDKEPVFCVRRETEQEAVEAAGTILEDYVRRFRPTAQVARPTLVDIPVWQIQAQKSYAAKVA